MLLFTPQAEKFFPEVISSTKSWSDLIKELPSHCDNLTNLVLADDNSASTVYNAKNREDLLSGPSQLVTAKLNKLNSASTSGKLIVSNAEKFFAELFDCPESAKCVRQILDKSWIDEETVLKEISSLPKNKSPGIDGIPYDFIKAFPSQFAKLLTKEFNDILRGNFKEYWKFEIIKLILKKGDLSNVNNWRLITLLNCAWKIFTSIINRRLWIHCINKLEIEQTGFIPGLWIQENHLVAEAVLKTGKKKKISGGITFLDFYHAFDTVFHKWIMDQIKKKCSDEPDLICIISLILGGKSSILWEGKVREIAFNIYRGVRQGDVISPLLFNIALDPFLKALRELEGISICGVKINTIAYADDCSIIIKNENDFILLDSILKKFEKQSGLSVNVKKTKFMPFAHSSLCHRLYENVKSFELLGVHFDNHGNYLWEPLMKNG